MRIYLSKITENEFYIPTKASFYDIIVDISKEQFLKHLPFYFYQILYPLYQRKKKYRVQNLSFPQVALSISPLLLHTNQAAITLHLLLEAWLYLSNPIKSTDKTTFSQIKLESLNQEQQKAVHLVKGPVCLLAPAGSGKTKTLVNRIYHLLNKGVSANHILVLVFNRKALQEIQQRVTEKITDPMEIYTFHSFGHRLLKENTNWEFFQEDPEELSNVLLEQAVLKTNKLIYKEDQDPLKEYRKMLSKVKNSLLEKEEMIFEQNHRSVDFYPIWQQYLKLWKEEKLYDFDDMLYLTLELLLQNGTLRRTLQHQYEYILVDEFQDLNEVQLWLLKILAFPQNNLFVVGDDDQMIYGFRGASIEPILNFAKEFPQGQTLALKVNYRSPRKLVYHANLLIEHNLKRTSKTMQAFQQDQGILQVRVAKDWHQELLAIEKWLEHHNQTETVILYRYQEYGIFLRLYLESIGYHFQESKQHPSILKKVHLLLKFLLKDQDIKEEYRNLFSIPQNVTTKDQLWNYLPKEYLKVREQLKKKDMTFRVLCLQLKISSEFFYDSQEIGEELFHLLSEYINMYGGVKKYFYHRPENATKEALFQLKTIHKTKGNEYDYVCYFHMNLKMDTTTLEEERRVSYVAVTRTKKELLITVQKKDCQLFAEYLQNKKYEMKTTADIEKENQDYKEELSMLNNQIQLLQKDQWAIKKRTNFVIAEQAETYYEKRQQLLKKKTEKRSNVEQLLFMGNEELQARKLLHQDSDDIINI